MQAPDHRDISSPGPLTPSVLCIFGLLAILLAVTVAWGVASGQVTKVEISRDPEATKIRPIEVQEAELVRELIWDAERRDPKAFEAFKVKHPDWLEVVNFVVPDGTAIVQDRDMLRVIVVAPRKPKPSASPATGRVHSSGKVQDRPATEPFVWVDEGSMKGTAQCYTSEGTAWQDANGRPIAPGPIRPRTTVRVEYTIGKYGQKTATKVVILKPAPPCPLPPPDHHWCMVVCECGCGKKGAGSCNCDGHECYIEGAVFDNGMFEPATGSMLFPVGFDPRDRPVKAVKGKARAECCRD